MFGEYFRECREKAHLTQEELVARMRRAGCSITLERYKLIEKNLSEPRLLDAAAMCEVLPAGIDELMGYPHL